MEAFLEAVAEDFPVEVPVRSRADPASVGVLRLGHAPSLRVCDFIGFSQTGMLKRNSLGTSKSAKNQKSHKLSA